MVVLLTVRERSYARAESVGVDMCTLNNDLLKKSSYLSKNKRPLLMTRLKISKVTLQIYYKKHHPTYLHIVRLENGQENRRLYRQG